MAEQDARKEGGTADAALGAGGTFEDLRRTVVAGAPQNQGGAEDASKKATVVPPTSPDDMVNPFAGTGTQGTARESTEDLLARVTADQGGQEGGSQVPSAGAGEKQPAKKQGQVSEELKRIQSELDRTKALVSSLQEDALIGKQVRSDPLLLRAVSDSMQGRTPQLGDTGASGQKSIEEELGLSANFIPIPEEFNQPGTDSYRWFNASMDRRAAQRDVALENRVKTVIEAERIQQQGLEERDRFITAHSEEDFAQLMTWVGEPANFSLERLWAYFKMDDKIAEAASRGALQPVQRQVTQSVTSMSGGGIPQEITQAQAVQVGLLKMAQDNKNPLISGGK